MNARPSSSDLSFFSKSKSSKSGASIAVQATTTRVVAVQRPVQRTPDPRVGAVKVTVRSATASPSPSTLATAEKRKRKISELNELPIKAKRARASSSASASKMPAKSRALSPTPSFGSPGPSRQSSLAPSPMPLLRSSKSRSRSVSVFPTAALRPRDCWVDEHGKPGPAFLSSESVVQDLIKTYKTYFRDPDDSDNRSFEVHPTIYPSVELEYPNSGASEKFVLLVPKDKDHYNPIMCLENTLHTIYKHYLTPIQQSWFGTLPSSNLADDDIPGPASLTEAALEASTALFPPPSALSVASSPASSSSDSSTDSSCSASSNSSATSITSVSSVSSIASLSSITNLSHHAIQISPTAAPTVNYLRLLQRAINKRDGPLFIKVMEAVNALLRLLKYPPLPPDPFESPPPNCFPDVVKSWTNIPKEVVTRIVDETYQRAVGPHVAELKRYEAFSSEVYGELMPALVSQIINETGLGPDSLFVDLGSGVGNIVLQASLQTGCKSFGIEIMPTPAKIARSQLEQIRIRCRMWGVKMGEVEVEEGDMLTSRKVDELVPQADVVLVNNKVFLEPLNEALRPKFLDLKEGAIVVSLKPFVSSSRLTERNLDDISAIFQVKERPYYAGSVSWGNGGGSYYLHRVDREGYADIKKRFENSRTTPARTTRSRR